MQEMKLFTSRPGRSPEVWPVYLTAPRISFLQKRKRLRKKWAREYDPVGFYWEAPLRAAFERARKKKELSAGEMIVVPMGHRVDVLDSGGNDPLTPPSFIVRKDVAEPPGCRVKINITGNLLEGTGVSMEDMAETMRVAREKVEQAAAGLPVRIPVTTFDPVTVAQCGANFRAHVGDSTIKAFNSFSTVEVGAPRYVLQIGRSGDYLYWNGSAWAVSDMSYAQANDQAQSYVLDKIEGVSRPRFKAFRLWVSVQARKIWRLFRCWK